MSWSSCHDGDPRGSGWRGKEGGTSLLGWVRQGFSAQETLSCIPKTKEELAGFVPGVTERVGSSPSCTCLPATLARKQRPVV